MAIGSMISTDGNFFRCSSKRQSRVAHLSVKHSKNIDVTNWNTRFKYTSAPGDRTRVDRFDGHAVSRKSGFEHVEHVYVTTRHTEVQILIVLVLAPEVSHIDSEIRTDATC